MIGTGIGLGPGTGPDPDPKTFSGEEYGQEYGQDSEEVCGQDSLLETQTSRHLWLSGGHLGPDWGGSHLGHPARQFDSLHSFLFFS